MKIVGGFLPLRVWGLAAVLVLPAAMSAAGRIEGKLQTESGAPVAGAKLIASPVLPPADGKLGKQVSAVSGEDGSFAFDQVPAGQYRICGTVAGSDLLNPCEWSNPVPTIDLAEGATSSGNVITLTKGTYVHVRVTDKGHWLRKKDTRPFLLNVWGPLGPRSLALVADDNDGRTFRTLVPFDTDVRLGVTPGALQVSDQAGKVLADGNSSVTAPTGNGQTGGKDAGFQQSFRVGKKDTPKTFQFTVGKPGN